ncbi:MAG: hypothetical protein WA902_08275 [Thermosynechococcaceae cyanobacterium]
MKFVVDAQLPRRLARYLEGMGHDVIIAKIIELFEDHRYIELSQRHVTAHQ